MPIEFDGIVWFAALLFSLTLIQRALHFEIQAIFLLLTRRAEIALALFSLLFFPGVLLHELSHFLMALALGVRTGRFSLFPQPLPDGRLRLGYVETQATDVVRDALIGTAPLIAGSGFVLYAGLLQLRLPLLWESWLAGGWPAFLDSMAGLPGQPDFWLWFYLIFTISSTMLPSRSDRRAWLPVGISIGFVVILAVFAGAGAWMALNLAPLLNRGLRGFAVVVGVSLAVHLVLLPPFWIVRRSLVRLTGLSVF